MGLLSAKSRRCAYSDCCGAASATEPKKLIWLASCLKIGFDSNEYLRQIWRIWTRFPLRLAFTRPIYARATRGRRKDLPHPVLVVGRMRITVNQSWSYVPNFIQRTIQGSIWLTIQPYFDQWHRRPIYAFRKRVARLGFGFPDAMLI